MAATTSCCCAVRFCTSASPTAACARRHYRPQWEEELLELQRIYHLLAPGRWFRQTNCQGEFWLGRQRYNVGRS
jgi:hypothetical protein